MNNDNKIPPDARTVIPGHDVAYHATEERKSVPMRSEIARPLSMPRQMTPPASVPVTTTLRIRHNGNPMQATIDLVSSDGTARPVDMVQRIAFESDGDYRRPAKLSLEFVFCEGTLEIDVPVNGDTVSRIVTSEQGSQRGIELAGAVHAVPDGAVGDGAPIWLVLLYKAARAVVGAGGGR